LVYEPVIPAVLKAKQVAGMGRSQDELLDAAVRENVRWVAAGLRARQKTIYSN
jgi:hypothetical protein